MKKINTKLLINQIVLDETLYPRNTYYWQVAYSYSSAMKSGAKFPKIVVAKLDNSFVLVDGKHRLEAYKLLKKKFVDVEVLVGLTKEKIFEEAVRRNITHGKPLSVQEKLQVAVKLRDMHYTTEKISQLVQIIPSQLKSLLGKRLFNSITGEEIVLKKEFEDVSKSPYAEVAKEDIETLQDNFTGQEPTHIIDELIVLLKTKALNLRDKKVKEKLLKLKSLLRKI